MSEDAGTQARHPESWCGATMPRGMLRIVRGGPGRRSLALVCLAGLAILLSLAAPSLAQDGGDCGPGTERAGAGCVSGTVTPEAPFVLDWTAGDEPGPGWEVDAEVGYASARVIVSAADGEVTRLEIPDGAYRGRFSPWIVAPGHYTLRLDTAAATPFRLRLSPLPADRREVEPNDTDETATNLPPDTSLAGDAAGDGAGGPDVFRVDVDGAAARQLHDLTLATPIGRAVDIAVLAADGSLLVQARSYGPTLALPDLGLAAGRYSLRISSPESAAVPYLLRLATAGPRVPGREAEPNDTTAGAQALAFGKAVTGRIARTGDVDTFRLTIGAPAAKALVALALAAKTDRTLCLLDAAGRDLQCRRGTAPALSGIGLAAGDYFVTVAGPPSETDRYALTARLAGPRREGVEVEPNDSAAFAGPLVPGAPLAGRLDADDVDWSVLHVAGAAELWTITAEGEGVGRVVVTDYSGAALGSGEGSGGAAVARDVFLLPGDYFVTVSGGEGAYRVTATPTGPPDPAAEREPNDTDAEAQQLAFDAPRRGALSDSLDRDVYRFSLFAPEHVLLTVTPDPPAPSGDGIEVELEWGYPSTKRPQGTTAGGPFVYDALLDPGDYVVRLKAAARTGYHVGLTRGDPFVLPTDLEPNDTPGQARALPPDGRVAGRVTSYRDVDWFRLSPPAGATILRVTTTGDVTLALQAAGSDIPAGADGGYDVAAGADLRLGVTGDGAYDLAAAYDGVSPPPEPEAAAVTATLTLATPVVAAFWPRGQRIAGTVTVANPSGTPATVALTLASSHYAYRPDPPAADLTLAPGETRALPITVAVAADAWAGQPVAIAARVAQAGHRDAGATARLVADPDAPPVAQETTFPLPDALLGGFDIASAALGGTITLPAGDTTRERPEVLQDGLVGDANTGAFAVPAEDLPYLLTLEFPGTRQWTVAGIALHPQAAGRIYPAEQLRDFDFLLSADGRTFDTVLSGALTMLPVEQAFVLPHPVPARAAQLRLRSNHADNIGSVGLGEWKVILVPGEPEGLSADIAEARRGGHVAWSNVPLGIGPDEERAMLGTGRSTQVAVPPGLAPTWVIGFHEDRAAQVVALEWQSATPVNGMNTIGRVRVEASRDGPLGPWEPVGDWTLDPVADAAQRWTLPAPLWARFLRFTAPPSDNPAGWLFPRALRILERPVGGGYRSILAEWGQYNAAAIYEAGLPPPPAVAPDEDEGNGHDAATARLLALGETVAGAARLGEREDWFAVEVPEGMNRLDVSLDGVPTVDVDAELQAADGTPVPLATASVAADRRRLTAPVEPGRYLLRVREPPRSVAIAYDTSPSLQNFAPVVRHAVADYAAGTVPGREYVNLMNFDSPFILKDWSDQPWVVEGAALGRPPADQTDSSDLEATLVSILDAFGQRSGAKAAIVVTDAETPSFARRPEVWDRLARERPRIFPAHIGAGHDPLREKQVMQDLAAVNGGFYVSARTQAEMDTVAARAGAWLRRPARYRLTLAVRNELPAEPGTLRVVAAPARARPAAPAASASPAPDLPAAHGALEIILDASGSMLQRLDGARRIEIARATLGRLVTETLPPGTPVALRVFGDDQPGSCETRLAAPLAPLDGGALARQIDAVVPKNRAKTPIGASLHAVRDDLAAAAGGRTVILVTDGEETCGGDPQAEIAALRGEGFDVRVNIVGFAVDDAGLKETFRRWAETGGGRYLDAVDAAGLDAAVAAAAALPFRVIDAAGAEVAHGLVGGDAVTLPAADYRVEVGDSATPAVLPVTISPAQASEVRYAP